MPKCYTLLCNLLFHHIVKLTYTYVFKMLILVAHTRFIAVTGTSVTKGYRRPRTLTIDNLCILLTCKFLLMFWLLWYWEELCWGWDVPSCTHNSWPFTSASQTPHATEAHCQAPIRIYTHIYRYTHSYIYTCVYYLYMCIYTTRARLQLISH